MFTAIPLLALPVAVYNLYVLTFPGAVMARDAARRLAEPLFSFKAAGGADWPVSFSDLLMAGALIVLFIELLKSTASRRLAVINHSLSMLLFVGCLVELLLLPACANSAFFLITLMVGLDVVAGFVATIAASRREVDVVGDR